MKKFFKIIAVILLSLLIFFVATLKYRQYKANQVALPKNATALVKISVDEIYKSLALNAAINPRFYFKSDTNAGQIKKVNKVESGLKIPANIYFYAIENQPSNAFFTRFEIEEFHLFENFLLNTLHLQIIKNHKGFIHSRSKTGTITISYNKKYAAIAISNELKDFEVALENIINQRNFITLVDSKFNALRKADHHITFAGKEFQSSLDFHSGSINFTSDLLSGKIIPAVKPSHRKFGAKSAISMWLNADFRSSNEKTPSLQKHKLTADSLLKYYGGYLDFEWINTIQQPDSIITYEYNDDFEKVEKLTVRNKKVPNFLINVNAETVGLKRYLSRQNIINIDSGLVNNAVFPLYKTFLGGTDKVLELSSGKLTTTVQTSISSDDFFGLDIDFTKLNSQIDFPFVSTFLPKFKRLKVSGKALGHNKIHVKGDLKLVNEDINSLYQLLELL